MPMYDYQCDICKQIKSVFHRVDEEHKDTCCDCLMRRTISKTTFKLASRGWERDGYTKARPLSWLNSDEHKRETGAFEEERSGNNNHGLHNFKVM